MQLQSMLIDRVSLPHLRSTTGFNRARYFQDYYLIDAEESIGDGFSFSGGQLVLYGEVSIGAPDIFSSPLFLWNGAGKYGEGPSKSDEWFAQGKMVRLCSVLLFFNWFEW
jgi:hypothetical protein